MIIRRELRAFEGLNAQARENRLRLLAMRLIMDPLIALSPLDRPPALAGLAPSQRAFVTGQLRAWDALPEEQRSRLLATHGGWIPLPTFEVLPPSPPVFTEPPAPPAPGFRSRVEMDLDRWAALGEQAQTNATRALIRLFGLSAKDQQAVLSRLEPHRRNLVERMLASFGRMEAESRSRAVAAFLRFAAMSPEDRTNFWRNADRWESLTSEERRAWRALTAHLPPLPPGLGPAPALPPAPPNASSSALRTNAQAAR